jgi:hypothetical protein
MPRTPKVDDDTLKALEQRLAKVQRDLRKARAAQKDQARRDETRRKVIGGDITETYALANPGTDWAKLYGKLLAESIRPRDRHLFAGLFQALLPPDEAAALLAATTQETGGGEKPGEIEAAK